MVKESKFSKLRLPVSKRKESGATTQISNFFARPNSSNTPDETLTKSIPSETEANCDSTQDDSNKIASSLPEPKTNAIEAKDSKPLFSSYESIPPSKMRRLDSNKLTGNRNTIKEFFTSQTNESDFETPPKKVAKKPPVFRKTKQNQKKQPKIKIALLKREQLLSNYMAEQSMADDVDPNEIQMALALSRSEVETSGKSGVDGEASNDSNSMDRICNKLAEFEYRSGRENGKNQQLYAAPKGRGKWANKFTSLTLRNPERQQEKLNQKIDEFLNFQYESVPSFESKAHENFSVTSSFLFHMKSIDEEKSVRHRDYETTSTDDFYVADVCKPTRSKPGNLLKDFRTIPGRDLSPVRIDWVHVEKVSNIETAENLTKEKNISVHVEKPTSIIAELCLPSTSKNNQDQNFYREQSPDLFMDAEEMFSIDEKLPENSLVVSVETVDESPNVSQTRLQSNPVPVPVNAEEQNKFTDIVTISSESNSNDMFTCEKFSSDEATVINTSGIWNQDLNYTLQNINAENHTEHPEDVIDLTQENIIDLTQTEIQESDEQALVLENQENLLQCSQISTNSNNDANLSQDSSSSSSIIVLSDDEVNYSIKVAKGFDISENSTRKSDSDVINSHGTVDYAGYNSPSTDSERNTDNLECNNVSPKQNISILDNLNYSLAHEIMSHSFQEAFEASHPIEDQVDTKESNVTPTEIDFLDLTQLSPANNNDVDMPSCSSNFQRSSDNDESKKFRKTHSDSFLLPKIVTPKSLKRHSSSKRFDEFLNNEVLLDNDCFDEPDEFDRIVFPNLQRVGSSAASREIHHLLTDDIKSPNASIDEIQIDDKKYLVKIQNIKPKPDYERMGSPTRLKELYKYGLKPLKRKQAIIMLEFIYNQTHPIILDDDMFEDHLEKNNVAKQDDADSEQILEDLSNGEERRMVKMGACTANLNKLNLQDCGGSFLLLDDGLCAETENEQYIFQTNIRSKISTANLPLHVAWFNLVRSNQKLHESILFYEPIDLQEIFMFFKSIGYRYDPKDLKRFFDNRSIIFQYDLSKEGSNRHIRKSQKLKQKIKAK